MKHEGLKRGRQTSDSVLTRFTSSFILPIRLPEFYARAVVRFGEEPGEGLFKNRVASVGRELAERREDEAGLVHARVREREGRRVRARVAVDEQVEVERARGVRARAASAERVLYLQKPREQFFGRGQRRAELRNGVEVSGLLAGDADRLRLVDRRKPRDAQ